MNDESTPNQIIKTSEVKKWRKIKQCYITDRI